MRRFALVLTVAVVIGLSSSRSARAQRFGTIGGPVTVAPLVYEAATYPVAMPSYGAPRIISGVYVPQYGYPRASYPYPARIYAGYGGNDFPFYGRPYGHAWEPFSWSAMSEYPAYPMTAYGVIGR